MRFLGNGKFEVHANFFPEGSHRTFQVADVTADLITAYLCDGDDHLNVAGNIDHRLIAHGGPGNDHLSGGGGPAVLDGGAGDDEIIAGSANNIVVGGTGADRLVAGSGEDILIAGFLDLNGNGINDTEDRADLHDAALLSLIDEWDGHGNSGDRVDDLRNGNGASGLQLAKGTTVIDDGDVDELTGSSDQDWFLYEVLVDIVTDLHPDEEEN